MDEGYILLHRKLLNNPICQNVNGFRIWLECLFAANYKDSKIDYGGKEIVVPRGAFVFGRLAWGKRLKMSDRTVDNWVKKMLKRGMISVLVSGQGMPTIYKIEKYEEYQSTGQVCGQVVTQVSDRLVRTSNKRKERNESNTKSEVTETNSEAEAVQAHFNLVFGTSFKSTKAWLKNFLYWRETYSVEEIKEAISEAKNDTWWNTHGGMTLIILFRTKDTKGENCDRIGGYLSKARAGIPKHILNQRRMTQ